MKKMNEIEMNATRGGIVGWLALFLFSVAIGVVLGYVGVR